MQDKREPITTYASHICHPDVSIIIVNWNSVNYTQKCIESIKEHTCHIDYEIIVIDGASNDGCGDMLKEHHPDVIFIQSETNDGFSQANNRAYASSNGEYLLFLNPDTVLLGPVIQTLYQKALTLDKAGAIGCKLLNCDGSIQTSCIQAVPTILNQVLDSEWLRHRLPTSSLWGMAPLFRNDSHAEEVAVISGACVMVNRAVFELVGQFSPEYFMYAEDVDLCYKIQTLGYRNYYVPDVSVVHFGGGSSNKAPSNFSIRMKRESMWRFLVKTRGTSYGLAYRLSMIVSSMFRLALLLPSVYMKKSSLTESDPTHALHKWSVIFKWGFKIQD